MPETLFNIISYIENTHSADICDYTPQDSDGLRVYRSYNATVTLEQLASSLEVILATHGWFVSCSTGDNILIEPEITREYNYKPEVFMYHVSDKKNREDISRHGLRLSTGGNTTMDRKYPKRVFLAIDFLAAMEFANFQCRDRPQIFKSGEKVTQSSRKISELDVWRVKLSNDVKLYRDILFPGRAVWTDSAIPKSNISRYKSWRCVSRIVSIMKRYGFV